MKEQQLEYTIPTCCLCGDDSGWFRENRLHIIKVQMSNETAKDAKRRRVCKACDPKR